MPTSDRSRSPASSRSPARRSEADAADALTAAATAVLGGDSDGEECEHGHSPFRKGLLPRAEEEEEALEDGEEDLGEAGVFGIEEVCAARAGC